MASPISEARQQRIDDLKAKLSAREGKKPYKENCVALREEIARLGAMA
jgi:hypothetical protein